MEIKNGISAIVVIAHIENEKIKHFSRNVELFKKTYPGLSYRYVLVAVNNDGDILTSTQTDYLIQDYYDSIDELVQDVEFAADEIKKWI